MIEGKILTASAIEEWACGSIYMATLIDVAVDRLIVLHVPMLVLVQGLQGIAPVRGGAIEERLEEPIFTYGALDRDTAVTVAQTATRWSGEGLSSADAHVLHAATGHYAGWPIVTTKSGPDWRRLLPDTPIELLP